MPVSKRSAARHSESDPVSKPSPFPRIAGKDWLALILGMALIVFLGIGLKAKPELLHWVAGIAGVLLFSTFLIRKFVSSSKTFYVASMLETKRFNPLFDQFKNSKWIEIASEIGAVLGYGAIAIDFFWGKKLRHGWQRAGLFLVSIFLMGIVSVLFFGNLSANPLIKGPGWLYSGLFGFFGLAGFLLLALLTTGIDGILKIAAGKTACPGVAPIIPGVQTPNVPLFVPLEAWVSLFAILVIHEAAHGFLARRHNLKIQSAGLLLAGFLPIGAFVKPDEEHMKKMDKQKQIHIMAAGPASNLYSCFLVGIIALLVGSALINPTIGEMSKQIQRNSSLGVRIVGIDQNITICGEVLPSPAYGQIEKNSRLLGVNDQNVSNINELSALLRTKPFDPKKFRLEKDGKITEKTLQANALGRFGIQIENIPNPGYKPPENTLLFLQIFQILGNIVTWFVLLSSFVAIANFLPIEPLDGGRIAKFMIAPYFRFLQMNEEDTERFVGRLFLWILIPLIILNALPIVL